MSSTKKQLGLRIKELRSIKKITQNKLAELIDIDSKHLSKIENGRSYPSFDTLEKIANSLDIELNEFFMFSHLQNKTLIIEEIDNILKNSDEAKLQLIYKLIKNVIL